MGNEYSLAIEVQVSLAGRVGRWLVGGEERGAPFSARLVTEVQALMAELGIPGNVEARVNGLSELPPEAQSPDDPLNRPAEWLALEVNGRLCPCNLPQASRAAAWAAKRLPLPWQSWQSADGWLADRLASGRPEDSQQAATFIGLLGADCLRRQAQLLLGPAQAEAYLQGLVSHFEGAEAASLAPPSQILPALHLALEARLSLSDQPQVAKSLRQCLQSAKPPQDAGEILRMDLQAPCVEILIHPNYLKPLTMADAAESTPSTRFPRLRNELYFITGLFFPPFKFVLVESMPLGSFAFRIGRLVGIPWVGLQPWEYLIAGETGREQAAYPIHGLAASLLGDPGETSLPDNVGPHWDALDYLVLCLAAELEENRLCFVGLPAVQILFDQLAIVQPKLVELARRRCAQEEAARVLRVLVRQGQSLLDLRSILEAFICFDTIQLDPADRWVPTEAMPVEQPASPGAPEYTRQMADFVVWWKQRIVSPLITDPRIQASTESGPSMIERYAEPASMDVRMKNIASLYSSEELQEVLPYLFMLAGSAANMSKAALEIVGRFCVKIGWKEDMSATELTTRMNDYYKQHPINQELVSSIKASAQEEAPTSEDAYTVKERFKYWP